MMVRIQYPDGKYDMVKVSQLDRLIAENRISGFCRTTGWVTIGRDPIRRNSRSFYLGLERRHPIGPLSRRRGDFQPLSSQESQPDGYSERRDG